MPDIQEQPDQDGDGRDPAGIAQDNSIPRGNIRLIDTKPLTQDELSKMEKWRTRTHIGEKSEK